MGVAPNKTFTFDGVSSSTYGVYITGEGVFNAPSRVVEMIEIPGRNGNYALDQGRFENIEVTYKCGMYDVNESNFATKIANFRNWICSKVGYVRLTDEYNPNEYRMAVYSRGLEVSHEMLIAGEFEIVFECKPQRWLTSGETAVTVANNGTITNPTLYPSSPLLQVTGYGTINIGGQTVTIDSGDIGNIIVYDGNTYTSTNVTSTQTHYCDFDNSALTSGDPIYVNGLSWTGSYEFNWGAYQLKTTTISSVTTGASATATKINSQIVNIVMTLPNFVFTYGTSASATSYTVVTTFGTIDPYTSSTNTFTSNGVVSISYNGARRITVTSSISRPTPTNVTSTLTVPTFTAYSSSTVLNSGATYIDLDIGEAYKINNGSIVSVNNAVYLPAELPTLASGSNQITYNNTVTQLKVTPRWWKV